MMRWIVYDTVSGETTISAAIVMCTGGRFTTTYYAIAANTSVVQCEEYTNGRKFYSRFAALVVEPHPDSQGL